MPILFEMGRASSALLFAGLVLLGASARQPERYHLDPTADAPSQVSTVEPARLRGRESFGLDANDAAAIDSRIGTPDSSAGGSAATLGRAEIGLAGSISAPPTTGPFATDSSYTELTDAAYLARAFDYVGWRPEAASYVKQHVRIELTQWNDSSATGLYFPGPTPTLSRISLPRHPNTVGERVISHELSHALDDARGFRNEIAGTILYDVWRVSQDETYPAAAWSARQVLQLRPESALNDRFRTSFHAMLDQQDWGHLALAVWEGVAWDVARLPPWFAHAYFPQLRPGAPVQEQPLRQDPDPAPADLAMRTQRVVDLIALWCGPVLPAARVSGPGVPCLDGRNTAWPDAPYPPLPGVGGRAAAAPLDGSAQGPGADQAGPALSAELAADPDTTATGGDPATVNDSTSAAASF